MANMERGELGVDVGGKRYTLRPTFDSICELEELLGKSIDSVLQSLNEGRRSGLRAVVWCCLQDAHADEIKVLKDASEWIEAAGGVDVAYDVINKMFSLNAPEEQTGGEANPRSAQAGTGEPSSPVLVGSA